jgi:hypothetical protein
MSKTKVIFRMFKGECLAIFPELPGDCNPRRTCLCYAHIGQHSAADVNLTPYTRPAKLAEYQPLVDELTGLGYDLRVGHRASRKDYNARVKACEVAK